MTALWDDADCVYTVIWQFITEHGELPHSDYVARTSGVSRIRLTTCIEILREQGRLEPTTLKPTAYDAWWRASRERDQTWQRPGEKPPKPVSWKGVSTTEST